MTRYVEYDLNTGRIIMEIHSEGEPSVRNGVGFFAIPDDLVFDLNNTIVKDGQLVKARETAEERREKERLRQEAKKKAQKRVRELCWEFLISTIEEDESRIAELRSEYAVLRNYL